MAIFPQGYTQISERCTHTEDGGAERRVLQQLQRCLEDDYWVWHNVPLGPTEVVVAARLGGTPSDPAAAS